MSNNNANVDESKSKFTPFRNEDAQNPFISVSEKDGCRDVKNKSYENIKFFFNETCDDDQVGVNELESPLNSDDIVNIETLLYNFEQITLSHNSSHDDYTAALISHYNENYNIKELLKICEYYGIHKTLNKSKKNRYSIFHNNI